MNWYIFVAEIENMVEPSAQPAVYGNTQQGGLFPFSSGAYPNKIICFPAVVIATISILVIIFWGVNGWLKWF